MRLDPGLRRDDEKTEREAIVLARRGQGTFKANVMRIERACRITGVTREEHLRASHCKPWRDSSNEERLDGENGSRTIAAIAASGMTVARLHRLRGQRGCPGVTRGPCRVPHQAGGLGDSRGPCGPVQRGAAGK